MPRHRRGKASQARPALIRCSHLTEDLERRVFLSAITFAAQTTYASGTSPRAVAVADLGNGQQDIVVTNDAANTVSVFLGNGDGTFAAQQTYDVGGTPLGLAIADLGNGHPDLVVANSSDNDVSVLLGNGDGTFQPQVTLATGDGPDAVAIGDLGNGHPDLVVANASDDTVSVLLGNGDGTFGTEQTYAVGTLPRAVAIASLGNGHPDIITANNPQGGGSISVLLGDGDGAFAAQTTYATGQSPTSLAVANLGNGHLDVVTANLNGNSLSVLLGNGDGTFAAQQTVAAGSFPIAVAVGDLGNGQQDLVVANSVDDNIGVYPGNGDGTFGTPTTFATGADPISVAIASLSSGLPDVVVANADDDNVGVLLNNTPNQLAFTQEPTSGSSTAALSPISVSVESPSGTVVTGDQSSVTLSIASGPSGATLGGTATETTASGVATFSNLTLTTAGTYTLKATDGSDTSANSSSFTITVPAPNKLAFAQQPVSTTTNTTLSPVTVDVENSSGTLLSSDTSDVTLAIASGPAGATLGGTVTVAAVGGVATFSNLSLATAGTYQLSATDGSDTAATSTSFTIAAPAANKLAFTQEPANTTTATTLPAVKVSVENASGALLTSDTSDVTLAIATGPTGAVLGGTTTVAAAAGVSTFSNLTLTTAGTYTLRATDGSDTSATSTSFVITVPAANKLAFAQEPVSTTTTSILAPVKVDVENSAGALLTSDTSNVTLAVASGTHGATLGGTTTVAAVAGVATFSNLSLPTTGTYTLIATDGSDTSVTSTSFTISLPTANKLVFAAEPVSTTTTATLGPIKIDIETSAGTLIASDTSSVTLAIASGPSGAALGGTATVAAVGGIATFSDLLLATAGTYTLRGSDGSDTAATSVSFTVSPPLANKLVIAAEPVNATTSTTLGTITVDVDNSAGTLLTTDQSNVTLAIATGPDGATLGGTTTVAAVDGVATFTGLFIATPGTNYTLTATDGTDVPASSTTFAITAPVNQTLVFTSQPVNTTLTGTIGTITVDIEDGSGTLLTTDDNDVTVSIAGNPAGAVLGGTTTVAAVNGVATFSNLTINTVGSYSITATEASEIAATSTPFTVYYPPVIVGQLDPEFGSGGLVKSNVGFTETDGVALDGTQSVVIGTTGTVPNESFSIARYNANGTLDAAFGTGGVATISFANSDDVPSAVSVLAGGQIVIAGTATTYVDGVATTSEFAVAELNANGTLDTSFGSGTGQVEFGFSTAATQDVLTAMAIGSNGIMYLGGRSDSRSTTGNDFAIIALNAAGQPDTAFGAGGQLLIDFDGGDDTINSLAVQKNGDLVAAGSATVGGTVEIGLARVLPTGVLDPHFGVKGLVTTSVRGVFDSATSVGIEPTGQIVIGGLSASVTVSGSTADFVVARYTAAGRLDRSFGGGAVVTSFGGPSAVTQILVETDGDIVASGKTAASLTDVVSNEMDVAVARYTPRGVLDESFNGSGRTVIDLSSATFITTASDDVIVPLVAAPLLETELDEFINSKQGVAVSTIGGDILDVGNSGDSTVEAEIITGGVDLAAAVLTAPPASIAGGTKSFASVEVTEDGADAAKETVTIELEIATDAQGNGALLVKSVAQKINLPGGRGHSFRIPFVYPATLPTAAYYILADVIGGSTPALRDLNQLNNLSPATATVTISPPVVSLVGSALTAESTFTIGKVVAIEFTLTNDGNVTAKGRTAIDLYLSTDQTTTDGTLIPTKPFAIALLPGASRLFRLSFPLPKSTAAGSFTLIAVIDPVQSLGSTDHTSSTVIDATPVTTAHR